MLSCIDFTFVLMDITFWFNFGQIRLFSKTIEWKFFSLTSASCVRFSLLTASSSKPILYTLGWSMYYEWIQKSIYSVSIGTIGCPLRVYCHCLAFYVSYPPYLHPNHAIAVLLSQTTRCLKRTIANLNSSTYWRQIIHFTEWKAVSTLKALDKCIPRYQFS